MRALVAEFPANVLKRPTLQVEVKEMTVRKSWIWCGLVLLSMAGVTWSQTDGGAAKAVEALEHQWLQSQKTNNPDLVAPLLADKFVGTGVDGKFNNRTEELADEKATKYTSVDYEDVKVTVFGNTAIATGATRAKGTDASGKPLDEHVRWTDTWVKMPSGKWQCVASQVSPIKS